MADEEAHCCVTWGHYGRPPAAACRAARRAQPAGLPVAPRRGASGHPIRVPGPGDPRPAGRLGTAARGDGPGQPGGHQDAAEGGRPAGPDHAAAVGRRSRLRPGLPPAPGRAARPRHATPAAGPGRGHIAVAAGHLARPVGGGLRRGPGGSKRGPGRAADQAQPRDHRRPRRARPVRADLRHRAGTRTPADAAGAGAARRERRGPVPRQPQAVAGQHARDRLELAGPGREYRRPAGHAAGTHGGRGPGLRRLGASHARAAAGRAVAAAAPPEPGNPHLRARAAAHRPARGGQGGRRVGQRRLPRRPVRRPGPVPRGPRRAGRGGAAGHSGQPAHRRRPGVGQPVRGRHPGRAARRVRSGRADEADPRAGDRAPQRAGHRRDRPARAGPDPASRRDADGGHRADHATGHPGQQRARLRAGDIPGRGEGGPAVRDGAHAAGGHDGDPHLPGGHVYSDVPLRHGVVHRRRPAREVPAARLQRGGRTGAAAPSAPRRGPAPVAPSAEDTPKTSGTARRASSRRTS